MLGLYIHAKACPKLSAMSVPNLLTTHFSNHLAIGLKLMTDPEVAKFHPIKIENRLNSYISAILGPPPTCTDVNDELVNHEPSFFPPFLGVANVF